MSSSQQHFKTVCRQWRHYRKLSQLDLALAADVSQRHVSWLETGRSQPSREMVLRLSIAMDIPLRERNSLFRAAGFAPAYSESKLDEPTMAPVMDALKRVLAHHDPLPAFVVDRFWNVKMSNGSADMLLSLGGANEDLHEEFGLAGKLNLALLSLHPDGIRRYVRNWEQVAPAFIRRLKVEAIASGDAEVQARFDRFIALAEPLSSDVSVTQGLLPVLPLQLAIDGLELNLFSVIATFGTPQDVTTDELRIESFYPGDAETDAFFREKARQ